MDIYFYAIITILFVGFGIYILAKLRSIENKGSTKELLEVIRLVQEGSKEDRRSLLDSLSRNTQSVNQRLDVATQVIGDLKKNLGEMSEIGRGMREFQEFLKNPKIRGNIGEQVLNELLTQMLPKHTFHLQYSFKTGERVDAAIQTSGGIIPIDSKFPMENYRKLISADKRSEKVHSKRDFLRDVKKHIDDISKKYILTQEGTIDYALMYVPSEAVYYEIVNNPSLFDYAGKKRVLPVSPTTFYAYLKAILMSFEGQKIESKAKEILKILTAISKDYEKVEGELGILQKHVTNANNMLGNIFQTLSRLGQKISSTKQIGD